MLANIAVVFALRQDLEHELITVVFGQTSMSCRTRSQDGCDGLWAYRDTYRVSKDLDWYYWVYKGIFWRIA